MQTVQLTALVDFLGEYFNVHLYPTEEQGGIFQPSDRLVQRIGLAVEPWPEIAEWLNQYQPDALWIHRPWKLALESLPAELGILYHHLPFDEYLTMGFSRPMAEAFRLEALEPLGYKQAPGLPARPIGMIGQVTNGSFSEWVELITREFGGYDSVSESRKPEITRMAVVGAMNDALIREAADRGVQLYMTGQYRPSAGKAVAETGMGVIAVGHGRSEDWGLQALARIVQNRWPDLEVITHP